MFELELTKRLHKDGIQKTANDLHLIYKEYDDVFLLKYNQIESDLSLPEVQQARGIIYYKDTLELASMAFTKFFNYGETNAHEVDFKNSSIFQKMDGTMIQLWWNKHSNQWEVGTTGTAYGEVENSLFGSFRELFFRTYNKQTGNDDIGKYLTKGITYMFELTTPFNIVVTLHETSAITLIGARDCRVVSPNYLEELRVEDIHIPGVTHSLKYKFDTIKDIQKYLQGVNFNFEGFVVCDKNFNRLKIKGEEYVRMHHLKNKSKEYELLNVVLKNEIEEYCAVIPEWKVPLNLIKKVYDDARSRVKEGFLEIKNKETMKEFALALQDKFKNDNPVVRQFSYFLYDVQRGHRQISDFENWIQDQGIAKIYKLIKEEIQKKC